MKLKSMIRDDCSDRGILLLRFLYFIILFCITPPVYAALDIEITGTAEHQVPISILPFAGEEKLAQSISGIVSNDLVRSGLFKLVAVTDKSAQQLQAVDHTTLAGVDLLAIGSADTLPNGRIKVK